MKTRIIHTKFWTDDYVRKLDSNTKLLYSWMLLNEYVDVLGIFEVSNDVISSQTNLSEKEIEKGKILLHNDGKIDCYKSYIYLKNAYKYQTYSGVKNASPKLRTIFEMSDDVIAHYMYHIELWLDEISSDLESFRDNAKYSKITNLFDRVVKRVSYTKDTPIHTPIYTPIHTPSDRGQNTEYRNKNTEIRIQNTENKNQKEEKKENLELAELVEFYNETFEKKVSSVKGFEKNYQKWIAIHDVNKIKQAIINARNDKFWRDKMTLAILFRTKNPQGEDVDYIEDLANRNQRYKGNIAII